MIQNKEAGSVFVFGWSIWLAGSAAAGAGGFFFVKYYFECLVYVQSTSLYCKIGIGYLVHTKKAAFWVLGRGDFKEKKEGSGQSLY